MAFANNVALSAYHELEGRPAGKLALHEKDGRYWLYLGSYWDPGWAIVEVTDPANPRYVRWLEAPRNTDAFQVQVADGKLICGTCPMPPAFGGDRRQDVGLEGILIYDLTQPDDPELIGHWGTGAQGTHRNFYSGGRYVHAATTLPGFDRELYAIVDIDDPTNPMVVSRWWWPGQHVAAGETYSDADLTKEQTGRPFNGVARGLWLHGGPYVCGERAYCPWTRAGMVTLDISDISAPSRVSALSFYPPLGSSIAVHSVVPLPDRNLAIVNSEALAERGKEPLSFVGLVDLSDETDPILMSLFPVPEPPKGYAAGDFYDLRARFGPHNQHQPQEQQCLMPSGDLVYMTYFNAGLQIFDISNPRRVRIVGSYIPDNPERRHGPYPTELVTQCEDVLVDRRGVIYMSERNSGLYVLEAQLPGKEL